MGFAGNVNLDGPGDAVGDHQRRRGEEGMVDLPMDPAGEVAIAREHGRRRDAALLDRLGHLGHQRAGVADAGGAAEADDAEAERLQVGEEAAAPQIFRRRAGTRRRARS